MPYGIMEATSHCFREWFIPLVVNSLAPGGFENIFQKVFFKLISWIDTLSNSCETALRSMPQNPSDDKSTLVQVMAWCRQAASHYLSQCCPRSLSPYGVTRPQWVKPFPELRRTYCQLNPLGQTSVKFESKYKIFLSRTSISKCHLQNVSHWVQISICQNVSIKISQNHEFNQAQNRWPLLAISTWLSLFSDMFSDIIILLLLPLSWIPMAFNIGMPALVQ